MRSSSLLLPLFLAMPLPAQDLLWRLEGIGGQVQRGTEVRRLGDVDGDGWEEVLEKAVRGVPWIHQTIQITSSRDGGVLSMSPPLASYYWSYVNQSLTPTGDMNQDGVPDYAVTVYDAGAPQTMQRVEVRSGLTHAMLWTATIPNAWSMMYGSTIAGALDLNGDGLRDLVTSAFRLSPHGTIIAYDNSGAELYRIIDPLLDVLVGVDLAPLGGDLDGDGKGDFLSAGPDNLARGAIVVFSGATGAVLRVSYGVQQGDALSYATGCGDMDGDGVPDYAGGGFWGASVVTAFSGATGLPIHTWRDPSSGYMGLELTGGFDLDQDGVNDLVAGALESWTHAMSGRDGTFLYSFLNARYPGSSGMGWGEALVAAPPGENYPLLIYSERDWSSTTNPYGANNIGPGLLWAYRGCPKGVRAFGQPDVTPGLPLPRSGMRDMPGQAVRFTLSNTPPGSAALLMYGISEQFLASTPLPAPLDLFGLTGVTLLTSSDALSFATTGTTGMAAGYAHADLVLPAGLSLDTVGTPLFAQWLWFDPTNLTRNGSTAGQRFRVR